MKYTCNVCTDNAKPAPDELHIRRNPDRPGYTQKVICPYDWITLRNVPPGYEPCQINPGAIAREISRQGVITCIGPWCAIYPCQRVRECAGLDKIAKRGK